MIEFTTLACDQRIVWCQPKNTVEYFNVFELTVSIPTKIEFWAQDFGFN